MSLSVMKENAILITGGSGKIGSKLVDHFLSIGRTVVFTSRSEEKIRQIDAEDGRSDGKNTEVTRPIDCPVCHRRILSGQSFCLYCGAEAETSPFRHHGH